MLRGLLGLMSGGAVLLAAANANAQYGPPRADVPPRPPPERIRATETSGCPPGYHPDTEIRYGPVIGGAITTGFGVGMIMFAIKDWDEPARESRFLAVFGGMHLAVGLPLITYGLVSERDVYVRDSSSQIALTVVPNPANPRLTVAGTF